MARSHFSFEKRRKELEKKKKEAKRLAKAERKAAEEAGEVVPKPVTTIDELGNVVEFLPETEADPESDEAPADKGDTSASADPPRAAACRRWVRQALSAVRARRPGDGRPAAISFLPHLDLNRTRR